jgi:hypothetical protein
MDTSVTIIGLLIIIIIAIPLYFVFRSNSVNRKKIQEVYDQYKHYNFSNGAELHKLVLAIDEIQKAFLLIDMSAPGKVSFVNLKEKKSCSLFTETEAGSGQIHKIGFEFADHNANKEFVTVYAAEHNHMGEIYLHEVRQMAITWQKIIQDCMVR